MNNKKYWNLSKEERKEQDKLDAKETEPKQKFYFWNYCKSYGWRQTGMMDGYNTEEELKKDSSYKFSVENNDIIKILKCV